MNAKFKWILVLVAYDDPGFSPHVLKERIVADEDEKLAAFMRGGELLDVLGDEDESIIEGYRKQVEKECLR